MNTNSSSVTIVTDDGGVSAGARGWQRGGGALGVFREEHACARAGAPPQLRHWPCHWFAESDEYAASPRGRLQVLYTSRASTRAVLRDPKPGRPLLQLIALAPDRPADPPVGPIVRQEREVLVYPDISSDTGSMTVGALTGKRGGRCHLGSVVTSLQSTPICATTIRGC